MWVPDVRREVTQQYLLGIDLACLAGITGKAPDALARTIRATGAALRRGHDRTDPELVLRDADLVFLSAVAHDLDDIARPRHAPASTLGTRIRRLVRLDLPRLLEQVQHLPAAERAEAVVRLLIATPFGTSDDALDALRAAGVAATEHCSPQEAASVHAWLALAFATGEHWEQALEHSAAETALHERIEAAHPCRRRHQPGHGPVHGRSHHRVGGTGDTGGDHGDVAERDSEQADEAALARVHALWRRAGLLGAAGRHEQAMRTHEQLEPLLRHIADPEVLGDITEDLTFLLAANQAARGVQALHAGAAGVAVEALTIAVRRFDDLVEHRLGDRMLPDQPRFAMAAAQFALGYAYHLHRPDDGVHAWTACARNLTVVPDLDPDLTARGHWLLSLAEAALCGEVTAPPSSDGHLLLPRLHLTDTTRLLRSDGVFLPWHPRTAPIHDLPVLSLLH